MFQENKIKDVINYIRFSNKRETIKRGGGGHIAVSKKINATKNKRTKMLNNSISYNSFLYAIGYKSHERNFMHGQDFISLLKECIKKNLKYLTFLSKFQNDTSPKGINILRYFITFFYL